MNLARQTTHSLQLTTNSLGGRACLGLSRGRTDDRRIVVSDDHRHGRSVRWVARASSPGLWRCSVVGTDRPWVEASIASIHSPRTPKARADEAVPRQTWQPTSSGGETTYKTTHKNNGVFRPGHGSGTPPDTFKLQGENSPARSSWRPTQTHRASNCAPQRTGSGPRHCEHHLGRRVLDDNFTSPFLYAVLQARQVFVSIIMDWIPQVVCLANQARLAARVSRSHACMEKERRGSRSGWLGRHCARHDGGSAGLAQSAVTDSQQPHQGSCPEDSPVHSSFSCELTAFSVTRTALSTLRISRLARVEASCSPRFPYCSNAFCLNHSQGSAFGMNRSVLLARRKQDEITLCCRARHEHLSVSFLSPFFLWQLLPPSRLRLLLVRSRSRLSVCAASPPASSKTTRRLTAETSRITR